MTAGYKPDHWDAVRTGEREEEDGPDEFGDYCPGCNPEPTMDEEDSNTCASCGKALS